MTQIQVRRGTAAAWTSANPILAQGEIGYEIDNHGIKVGDGSTAWDSLSYFPVSWSALLNAPTYIAAGSSKAVARGVIDAEATTAKGTANGYCGLDGSSKVAISNLPTGSTSSTVCVGNDSRLSDARTPTAANQVADMSIVAFGSGTVRATGTGDFPFGVKLQRALTLTSVTYRVATADVSGNLVVELRKNGSAVSGSSATIAAANQVTGGTATGTWSFAAGDIVTVQITANGNFIGNGLIADITGVTA